MLVKHYQPKDSFIKAPVSVPHLFGSYIKLFITVIFRGRVYAELQFCQFKKHFIKCNTKGDFTFLKLLAIVVPCRNFTIHETSTAPKVLSGKGFFRLKCSSH